MTEKWEIAALPRNWRLSTPPPTELQNLGSDWIRSLRTAVLLVPSAMIPEEFNVRLNPAHPDYARLEVGRPRRFQFDTRMWKH
jgi:RES domain-containing protein